MRDKIVERALLEQSIGRITQETATELLELAHRYETTLQYISTMPEPAPKQVAKQALHDNAVYVISFSWGQIESAWNRIYTGFSIPLEKLQGELQKLIDER